MPGSSNANAGALRDTKFGTEKQSVVNALRRDYDDTATTSFIGYFWEKMAEQKVARDLWCPFCEEEKEEDKLVGGHVRLQDKPDSGIFITQICIDCNTKGSAVGGLVHSDYLIPAPCPPQTSRVLTMANGQPPPSLQNSLDDICPGREPTMCYCHEES